MKLRAISLADPDGEPVVYDRSCIAKPWRIGDFGFRSAEKAVAQSEGEGAIGFAPKIIRVDSPDEPIVVSGPQPFNRQAWVQPVDGSAGSVVHPPVHRPGLRIQRLQSADDQADRRRQIRA